MIDHEKWWNRDRFKHTTRPYKQIDVDSLRGSVKIEHTLAKMGAEKLWDKLHRKTIRALGALTGNQAMQQAKAGLEAIYLSGWQVAGDANDSLHMYPDQSLYSVSSVPTIVKRINNTFQRADQIQWSEDTDLWDEEFRPKKMGMKDENFIDYFLPIIADAESGFGGVLNIHELCKALIEAGASGIHIEDQLASAKKCGHMGGKVLVSTQEMINKLVSARLAADIMDCPTVIIGRTDSLAGALLQSDSDPRDHKFLTGERTEEGFFRVNAGMDQAVARGLDYGEYVDLLWMETSNPDIGEITEFCREIKSVYPNMLFAYNCSPSFNWKAKLSNTEIINFQDELSELDVKFQFITLAGFHSLNYSMFDLAEKYKTKHMEAFVELQQKEFEASDRGFTAVKHQREVGAGYFDKVAQVCTGSSTLSAISGSTEEEQF